MEIQNLCKMIYGENFKSVNLWNNSLIIKFSNNKEKVLDIENFIFKDLNKYFVKNFNRCIRIKKSEIIISNPNEYIIKNFDKKVNFLDIKKFLLNSKEKLLNFQKRQNLLRRH